MSLNLNPDVEAQLISLAQATGVSVEEYLLRLVEEKTAPSQALRLSPEEWAAQFEEWADIVTHEVRGAKVHDARLAAIMQVHGVKQILTFNTADFKRFSDIVAVHPGALIR